MINSDDAVPEEQMPQPIVHLSLPYFATTVGHPGDKRTNKSLEDFCSDFGGMPVVVDSALKYKEVVRYVTSYLEHCDFRKSSRMFYSGLKYDYNVSCLTPTISFEILSKIIYFLTLI